MLHFVILLYDEFQPKLKFSIKTKKNSKFYLLENVVDAKILVLNHEQEHMMNNYFVEEEEQSKKI